MLAALLLAGCASRPLAEEDSARIRKVGVVWLVPQVATFEKLGFTVFGNERGTMEMGEPLEPLVVRTLTERLAHTRPAWQVVPVTYDPVALLKKTRSGSFVMSSALERVEADLRAIAAPGQADALLVFTPMQYENSPHFGGGGIGVWRRALPGIDDPILHANFSLAVVDAGGKILVTGTSMDYANPIRVTSGDYARQPPADAETRARLQGDLRNLTLHNVRARAQELGF
jgi:hypothetical protein